ncbi:MAG: hypothetical protein LC104_12865 [Bacteroidales bacterium]|nr:hypothetical protein [Bacteroidales bacterium]
MSQPAFAEIVEAIGQLPDEDQAAIIDLLQRRLAEAGRRRIATDIQEANAEFAAGQCEPAAPDDILRNILS